MTTLREVIAATPALAGKSYPEIAAYLAEQPLIANPVKAAPDVPKRITMLDVFQAVAAANPADLAKAGAIPGWLIDRAEQMMEVNDRDGMANYLTTIAATAQLSAASQQALAARWQRRLKIRHGRQPSPARRAGKRWGWRLRRVRRMCKRLRTNGGRLCRF